MGGGFPTNTILLVIKHCTSVTTGTYLCTSKIKNASPGSIPKLKQSELIKVWENVISFFFFLKKKEQNQALINKFGFFQ